MYLKQLNDSNNDCLDMVVKCVQRAYPNNGFYTGYDLYWVGQFITKNGTGNEFNTYISITLDRIHELDQKYQ